MALKKGEVANRILTVGDPNRAELLSNFLDKNNSIFILSSKRGFTTYTGTFQGIPISIIATGMGIPMMDFVVRETREIVQGEMAFIR